MKKVRNEKKSLNDWAIADFGQVFDFISTFQFSREGLSEEKTRNGIQYIHYGDIHAKFRGELLDLESESLPFVMDALLSQQEIADKEFPFLKEGDLIIADVSEDYEGVGECVELKNLNGRKVIGGLHTFVARAKDGITAPGLRTYLLKHRQVVREFRRIATGASVYGISKSNLARVKLTLPPLPEQRKIAAIFSTWDRALEKIEALIEVKKRLKRGLMQVLLTGKKKFRTNNNAGKWEKITLEEALEKIVGGGTPSRSELKYWNGTIPWITVKDLKGPYLFDSEEHIDPIGIQESATNLIPAGTVLMATRMAVGKVAKLMVDATINQDLKAFFPKKSLRSDFLFWLLISKTEALEKHGTGSTVKGIRLELVHSIPIYLPPLPEQKRIADCLGILDREIALLEKKTDKFREQKKGLMQNLLTGSLRVKV